VPTRVLGLDPGLGVTGYGVISVTGRRVTLIEGGAIRTAANQPIATRLACLHADVLALLDEHVPDLVVVEELFAAYSHPRTAIVMAQARGVLLLAAELRGVPVVGYPATEVKRALTGSGRASKAQIQRTVAARLKLSTVPEPPDVADALALALCHAGRLRAT